MTQDISAIQTFLAYCHKVDRETAREVAELFMEDGILRLTMRKECKGRVEVELVCLLLRENTSKVRTLSTS